MLLKLCGVLFVAHITRDFLQWQFQISKKIFMGSKIVCFNMTFIRQNKFNKRYINMLFQLPPSAVYVAFLIHILQIICDFILCRLSVILYYPYTLPPPLPWIIRSNYKTDEENKSFTYQAS